jgi:hypothetical protein
MKDERRQEEVMICLRCRAGLLRREQKQEEWPQKRNPQNNENLQVFGINYLASLN